MAFAASLACVNQLLLRKQHLAEPSRIAGIVQIARDIYGLHASNPTTPYLSLFARARDFTRGQLDRELYVHKSLGKIRCVRATVHVSPQETIPVAFAATKSLVMPRSEDFLRITGGVTQAQYEEVSRDILRILKGEGLSTALIRKRLGTGLNVSPIVNLMCDRGLLVRGHPDKGWRSNTHTYYLFSLDYPGERPGGRGMGPERRPAAGGEAPDVRAARSESAPPGGAARPGHGGVRAGPGRGAGDVRRHGAPDPKERRRVHVAPGATAGKTPPPLAELPQFDLQSSFHRSF